MSRRSFVFEFVTILVMAVLVAISSTASAANARITDIIVTQGSDDLHVFATLEDAFTKEIQESIVNGVPTTFTYYLRLMRHRALLPDVEIASLTVTQKVSYDLLRDEFTFIREGGGEKLVQVTKRYAQVKRWMEGLRGIRLGSLKDLKKDNIYYVVIKAEIRSIKLAFPLNYLLFFLSFFNFDTSWARSAFFKKVEA